ncbi:MAG: restriction endonuclease subunit S [Clostridiaceae bacterium]|nr:restriction endonuclease subunit S [Clostridiaceae bacterium]
MQGKASIPAIRFAGFTDAWEQRKLGELGSVSMCRRIFKEQTSENGEIPFYKIGTFGGEPDAYISRELFEEYRVKYPFPQIGDILISASGSIGRTVEFAGGNEYFQDSNIVWLGHDERLDNSFLKYFYAVVRWAGIEGSTIKRLYNDNILNTVIILPSVEEQREIGKFFRHLDHLITLHQRKYSRLCNVKKSMLEKMFPKDGASMPEIRFAGFTDAWEQRKVSELFRVTRGHVLAATQTETEKTDEKPYPVYSSQTKDKGLMGYYKDYLYEDAITWTTDGANAGTVNYRAGKFYCTNVCGVLLSNEVKANQMIAEVLNNVAKGYVSYVGNPKLMNNVMADIVIKIPTQAEEREQLSSFFASLDNLITLHQRELERLQNIKKACLEKMFV